MAAALRAALRVAMVPEVVATAKAAMGRARMEQRVEPAELEGMGATQASLGHRCGVGHSPRTRCL